MCKPRFLSSLVITSLLALAGADDSTATVTNYITPDCFQQAYEQALTANPPNLASGIPIKFVYENGQSAGGVDGGAAIPTTAPTNVPATAAKHKTYVTSSDHTYAYSTDEMEVNSVTDCQGNKCTTKVETKAVPKVGTTSTPHIFTTVETEEAEKAETTEKATDAEVKMAQTTDDSSSTDEERSTIVQMATATDVATNVAKITQSADTTTKTIFKATATPSTTYVPVTEHETITTTMKKPLLTGKLATKTKTDTKSIDNMKLKAFTMDDDDDESSSSSSSSVSSTKVSNSSVSAPSSLANSTIMNAATSTIDLRISSGSSGSSSLPTTLSLSGKKYSNGTEDSVSSESNLAPDFFSSSVIGVAAAAGGSSSAVGGSVGSSTTNAASSVGSSATDSASTSESPLKSESISAVSSDVTVSTATAGGDAQNLFEPIATDEPLSIFKREALIKDIPKGVSNDDKPYQTNKFSTNLILDNQTNMIWSYPYGMFYREKGFYGLGVQHTNSSSRIFGDQNANNKGKSYFFNPTNNAEVLFSADELTEDKHFMGVSDLKMMSIVAKFTPEEDQLDSNYLEMPIVQGMGFVTGIYHGNLTPTLKTLIGYDSLEQESSDALPKNVLKYRATLMNEYQYLIYITLPQGTSKDDFELKNDNAYGLIGSKAVDGLIMQAAAAPEDSEQDGYYDQAAGQYAISASLDGSTSGKNAEYSFKYETKGTSSSGKTMMFALPHHVQSISSDTKKESTPVKLESTTKGEMTAYLTNELKMTEEIHTDLGFLPWSPNMNKKLNYDKEQVQLMAESAQEEFKYDIRGSVENADSFYFAGKIVDKFANVLLILNDVIKDDNYTKTALEELKTAFELFTNNKQYYPLMYDTKFKGVTSSASQGGDTGLDFGAAFYNDHHFHYGYFVHAAAVVGQVDKKFGGSWAEDNKDWVNNLVRDVANPSEEDSFFPVSRMFDWFAGHSWAGGLFSSGDGRNEESSSEDYHFAYGMKLWGNVIGNSAMEQRGNLMISVMKRSLINYFYFKDDNKNVPKEMLPNKVSGIFFDNKIAFTTYFGGANEYPQYVHGIHMIPMTGAAALIREQDYAKQEWEQTIKSFVDSVDDGWLGILRLNQALFDPSSAYDFFSSDDFKDTYLDNGQSRTWSLAFSAALLNSM